MNRAPTEVGSAANSYEILAKLATGGMAEIFLARGASDTGVERYVVLKRVLRHRATDTHFVQMFLDEAKLAAQLQHPNIAQVYDVGKLDDSYFFTMEYVHGETVRSLLHRSHGRRQPISIGAVLSIVAGAAAGLQHAHERNGLDGRHLRIVHRDISPSNLMVSYEGTVKVVDFGIAKTAARTAETASGTVKGKISYMSPEQCKGTEVDRRSDLFSLGIVMWELLTTEKLFRKGNDYETMQSVISEVPPSPSHLRAEVTPEIDAIALRLLAKDPAARYQTADELHEAIENAAVKTGSVLSASALGRYMRELFGQRPEPWLGLPARDESRDQHYGAYAVTSDSAPSQLALSPAAELDRKLSAVPAITQRSLTSAAETVPLEVPSLRGEAKLMQPFLLDAGLHERFRAPSVRAGHARVRKVIDLTVTGEELRAPSSYPSGSIPPPFAAQRNPQYRIASSGSHPAFVIPPSYTVTQRMRLPAPRVVHLRRRIIVAASIVVGLGLGILVGFGGNSDQRDPTTTGDENATPSAGVTAMVATAEPAARPTPTQPVLRERKLEPSRASAAKSQEPKQDISALFKAGNYGDVVEVCDSSSRFVALYAMACTVSACKAKHPSKAKRWFAYVGAAKQASAIKDCDGVIAPETPPSDSDDCKTDPMACQH